MPPIYVQVRLGGGNASEGRVEVLYNGTWGTVCDDYWDLNDANVVCRMAGFESALYATNYASFGQGTGPIWLDDVNCLGSETTITECEYIGWNKSNCWHGEDAGAVCYGELRWCMHTHTRTHTHTHTRNWLKLSRRMVY